MYRYAENKWTIKEVISHLIDMERMYSYRMLRFARNDQTVSPGFDAENYVLYSGANEREIVDLLAALEAVRNATILLLNGLTKKALLSSGNVSGYPVTVER